MTEEATSNVDAVTEGRCTVRLLLESCSASFDFVSQFLEIDDQLVNLRIDGFLTA